MENIDSENKREEEKDLMIILPCLLIIIFIEQKEIRII